MLERRRFVDGDLHDGRLELGDHAGQRKDVEHPLATGQQVDDVAVGVGQHRAVPDQDQLGRGQIDPQVAPQALDRLAGLLQLEAGIQKALITLSSSTSR